MNTRKKPIFIAGPCAAENHDQITHSIDQALRRNVEFMRVSLWKPRTKPGFDGIGHDGLSLLQEAAKRGINPATEVIMPSHAERVIDAVLSATPTAKVMVWIGARNQNHYVQREIAKAASIDKRVILMVKNQPWYSKEHWNGIIEHVLDGGIESSNLLICHRGFALHNTHNPHGYRNIPDFELAMEMKQEHNLPMVFDPSHIGGSVSNVLQVAEEAADHAFDGYIVEVHPDPKNAKTDAKQQLTWEEYDTMVEKITAKNPYLSGSFVN